MRHCIGAKFCVRFWRKEPAHRYKIFNARVTIVQLQDHDCREAPPLAGRLVVDNASGYWLSSFSKSWIGDALFRTLYSITQLRIVAQSFSRCQAEIKKRDKTPCRSFWRRRRPDILARRAGPVCPVVFIASMRLLILCCAITSHRHWVPA